MITLFVGGLIVLAVGGVAMYRYLNGPKETPKTTYQEICDIKDRLYRDMVRLEALQGHKTASENVHRIMCDARL
jgi:hypothetical protein